MTIDALHHIILQVPTTIDYGNYTDGPGNIWKRVTTTVCFPVGNFMPSMVTDDSLVVKISRIVVVNLVR